ncbi:MAG: ubiquinone/menaquinone biosynthesis methyltransferase, partial [bacterium]|nr:ubiquinone/menaquinone biosynthesis methyltransferase [bacterium]
VGPGGGVTVTDSTAAMRDQGRARMADRGLIGNVEYVQVNAEAIPFEDGRCDCVPIGFGLRNVTDKQKALDELFRVLRPGGRALILEFSHPRSEPLKWAYDAYSFNLLPLIGKLVTKDEDSYRYLAESIRMHPDQETLRGMMEQSGWERCDYHNLTGGVVAVHRGYKL